MSWGIKPNAPEKEKIFADFADELKGMNATASITYRVYSRLFDIGKELADKEYAQGRQDVAEEIIQKLEEERDNLFRCDEDDYENGMKAGYQYSIEAVEELREKE